MKKFILSILTFVNGIAYSQYSGYYNINTNSNVNVNANVNHNVKGSVYEYKTISTIDYGALQLANAQREKNRFEQEKFADEKQKQMAVEITENPLKSYDYGNLFTLSSKDKNMFKTKQSKENLKLIKESSGFSAFRIDYVVPFSFFTFLSLYELQNVSSDGVKTDLLMFVPFYNKEKVKFDFESNFDNVIVGKEIEEPDDQGKMRKTIYHKKELNRATIYGSKGYRITLVWEDKFEYCISDNYVYYEKNFGNGYTVAVNVRYNGNKTEVDFEKLEGRRHYLKPLIEKIISTAKVGDLKTL